MSKTTSTLQSLFVLYCIASLSCGGNDKNVTPPATPTANISNVSQQRSTTTTTLHFTVTLSKASGSDVTIHYATVAGSAVANKDFTPASGTLTITANTNSAQINVDITGDSLRRANQTFDVQLSDPQGCTIGTAKGTATIINENNLYLPTDNAGYTSANNYAGYHLDWSDEFNGSAVNEAVWNFEQGNNNGWGNNELENYTGRTQNAFVSSGNLIIEARSESYNGNQYTSARMTTQNKKSFQFGRIDIRAKLPSGQGIWPALWMLGDNITSKDWPACGEIDIMEVVGHEPNKVYGTLHYGASAATHQQYGSNYILSSGTFDQQFHVFSLVWAQDTLKILVDDLEYLSATRTNISGTYPFNDSFFFLFNVAVGGNWPGSPDGTTIFPQRMFVDYVRVFKKN